MREITKYNKFNGCCGNLKSRSHCGDILCAELDDNNDIIYRIGTSNIDGGTVSPKIDSDQKSIGQTASCVLNVNISNFQNSSDKFCTDCDLVNGNYKAYYYRDNTLTNGTTSSSQYKGRWYFSLCNQDIKLDRCGAVEGELFLTAEQTTPTASSVYLNCIIYEHGLSYDVPRARTNGTISSFDATHSLRGAGELNDTPTHSDSDYFGGIPSNVFYRGRQEVGIITSGYYNTVNCKEFTYVSLIAETGTIHCNWTNAVVTINSDNSDDSSILYQLNYNYDHLYDKQNNPYNVPVQTRTQPSLCLMGCIDEYSTATTGNMHYDGYYPSNTICDESEFLLEFHNEDKVTYEYVKPPLAYVLDINTNETESDCASLSGQYILFYDRKHNESHYSQNRYPPFIYTHEFFNYEDHPSGIGLPVNCSPCHDYPNSKFPCINKIEFNLNTRQLYLYSQTTSTTFTAQYSGVHSYNNYNNLFLKDSFINLTNTSVSSNSGNCPFTDYTMHIAPYKFTESVGCLPKPRSLMFKGGKIPDAFVVDIDGEWLGGYMNKYHNYGDTPIMLPDIYKSVELIGSGYDPFYFTNYICESVIMSFTQDSPNYILQPQLALPGSTGCAIRLTNCTEDGWSAPNGTFLLNRVDKYPGEENCDVISNCPSYSKDYIGGVTTSYYFPSDDRFDGYYKYSYFNECPNNPCDWRSLELGLSYDPFTSGINAILTVTYQDFPCDYLSECSGNFSLTQSRLELPNGLSGLDVYQPICSTCPNIDRPNYVNINACSGMPTLLSGAGATDPTDPGTPYHRLVTFTGSFPIKTDLSGYTGNSYYDGFNSDYFHYIVDVESELELDIWHNNLIPVTGLYGNSTYGDWCRIPEKYNIDITNITTRSCAISRFVSQNVTVSGNFVFFDEDLPLDDLTFHPKWNGGTVKIQGVYY